VVRHKHTQFPGRGRREGNVVGERLWPTYAAKAIGLFFLTSAVLAFLGGVFQINPIWIYGPFDPAQVSSASQPDWYMGWLDGALRIMPGWEFRAGGFEIPNPFFPGVLLAGITFGLLYAWPFLEARVTGDHDEHHVLDRPRQRPVRTALGVATLAFFVVCFVGGAADVIAATFGLSVNAVPWSFRALVLLPPPVAACAGYRLRKAAAGADARPRRRAAAPQAAAVRWPAGSASRPTCSRTPPPWAAAVRASTSGPSSKVTSTVAPGGTGTRRKARSVRSGRGSEP